MQLVLPLGDVRQYQAFEDRQIAGEGGAMRRQVLRVEQIDARRVESDEPDSPFGEEVHQFRRQGGEVLAEDLRIGIAVRGQQQARLLDRMRQMSGQDAASARAPGRASPDMGRDTDREAAGRRGTRRHNGWERPRQHEMSGGVQARQGDIVAGARCRAALRGAAAYRPAKRPGAEKPKARCRES